MSDWTTTGIDVSHYQDTADYASILKYMEFAFVKATEGTAPDATMNAHLAYLTAHNVPIIGGYHFGRNDVKIADQLKAYLARAGHLKAHFLDVEGAHFLSVAQGRYFIDGMHDHGLRSGLYASESKWSDPALARLEWGQDWNFIANYSREPTHPYDVWQFGPAAANVDGDRSHHTLAELRALMEGTMPDLDLTRFPEDAPRRFASKPGVTALRRFTRDAEVTPPIDAPYTGYVDREVAILATTGPHGAGFLRLSSGGSAGKFILAAEVNVTAPAPAVADCTLPIQAATDPLNAEIAQLRTDVTNAELAGRQAEWDRQNAGATVAARLLDRP